MNEKRRWGGSIVEIRLTWAFQTRVYGKSIRCINPRLDLSWDESYRNVISSEWKVILRRNVSNIHAWCKCLISRSLLTKNIVRCESLRFWDVQICSSVEMFSEHGREWKGNFESLMYRFVRGSIFGIVSNRFIFHVLQKFYLENWKLDFCFVQV